MDIAKGETTEKELDALIRRRHDHRVVEEGERPAEEAWAESERRYAARRREALCWEWLRFRQRQLNNRRRVFALLEAHDLAEIRRYEQMLNIDYQGGDAA